MTIPYSIVTVKILQHCPLLPSYYVCTFPWLFHPQLELNFFNLYLKEPSSGERSSPELELLFWLPARLLLMATLLPPFSPNLFNSIAVFSQHHQHPCSCSGSNLSFMFCSFYILRSQCIFVLFSASCFQ